MIHAWAGHKSIRRKDGGDDDRPPGNWHDESRSNETHESKSDGESRLYRKSNAAPALPSYLGHVLTDNRHGLVVNVQASTANGRAERQVAADMLREVSGSDVWITVGADRAYDTRGFVKACREYNVTSHAIRSARAEVPSTAGRRGTSVMR